MKTILIETVSNGWIVRPFQPGPTWSTSDTPHIAVFNTIQELCAALPKLLTYPREDELATTWIMPSPPHT